MSRAFLHRRAAGNTGNDGDRVARLHRRLAVGELPDVAVVHVDVDEAAQPAVGGKEMRLQPGVLAGQPVEQLAHTPPLQLDCVTPAHERAERRRDQNRHCHTTFRSPLVIDSSSKAPRSSVRTQLSNPPARPRPTPTLAYRSPESGAMTTTTASDEWTGPRADSTRSAATMAAPDDHPTNSPASFASRRTASSASSVATNSVRFGSAGS